MSRFRTTLLALLAGLVLAFPWLPFTRLSLVVNANLAGEFALIAISLVILTGWVGQISLGQGAFVGIGAFTTGLLARELGIPFPLNLPLAAMVSAGVASLLGVVALRVRGLYLAVATLILAWMADAYLFSASWFVGSGGASSIPNVTIGRPGTLTYFDLSNDRVFYYVVLAAVVAGWFGAQNLRQSKTGRAFFAIRGSETAAVSLGIDVTRYKLLAFAISGALAGIAGNLMMTDLRTASPHGFQFTVSLFYLSIAVVGGIANLGGAVAASVLFAGLNELFFRVPALTGWLDLVSIGLLLVVLLGYPGGLGALGVATGSALSKVGGKRLRAKEPSLGKSAVESRVTSKSKRPGAVRKTLASLRRILPSVPSIKLPFAGIGRRRGGQRLERRSLDLSALHKGGGDPSAEPAIEEEPILDWRSSEPAPFALPADRMQRESVLEAEGITVRFGGLTAVDDVSISVREHEITGLIGPNGAGKTTLFNAIAGLNNPTAGKVRVFGQDVTNLPVHVRAQLGVGRTFQLIQLFPQLTVFENLLVATHVHNPTGVFSHLALTTKAAHSEGEAREMVRRVVDLLGLHDFAERRVAGLPFGILRQVEIARAIVTGSPLLMLDEPASGLDNSETDELSKLLKFLRTNVRVTILLIEHDVRMVTAVCDYIHVIDRGSLISEGTSAEIQRDPQVIAAYLGEPKGDEELLAAGPTKG